MTTGQRMKERRKELGLSAENVAERLGLSPATIYRYENGDIDKVPGDRLEPIAKILRTTPAYLMGWDKKEPTIVDDDGLSQKLAQRPKLRELMDILYNADDDGLDTLIRLAKMIDKEKSDD